MSFLDSVLSSIETGKPSSVSPATTPRPPASPIPSSTAKSEVRKPSTGIRDIPERKNVAAGTKRKAEEQLRRPSNPNTQLPGRTAVPKTNTQLPGRPAASKPATTSTAASKARLNPASGAAKPTSGSSGSTAQKPAAVSSKPPPKGSYADLMAKAKSLQDKAPTQVGMFKHHQSTPREKLSKAERKKRATEALAKEKNSRSGKKAATPAGAAGAKAGDGKPIRKREPEELSYKGTARPSQPLSGYRGTAGIPSRRNPNDKAQSRAGKRRVDEYLATDEEDEGDYADDYDDYYSESSDMEAGLDDVEQEEASALKFARKEDEEEWLAEQKAKQEKLERRKKLSALASRSR
ncbi:hypothetical protein ASPWEDRAFT_45120 [Aspergillus wentii DTO 134E9]|uniref:SPT2 chromatin protein n=1 Tax=Aspergillus wentii DTO 134E9 TaxID=1073089 RepID=A0A1L9R8B8_ASPWE|nr:uncharacterized protein ASPWEDRAFT_45120 [Aspergillus wentii DTO 134E9]KAI9924995.1 hypothetical protein MW887_006402 [Aspergillus wentii]OJJ31161.1 hypothetical protein ASPWEDRAFT_45120 [Aspergillus wentii DTO 134E9]